MSVGRSKRTPTRGQVQSQAGEGLTSTRSARPPPATAARCRSVSTNSVPAAAALRTRTHQPGAVGAQRQQPMGQPVEPAVPPALLRGRARERPRRRSRPDRPARTSRASRTGRCRSDRATAPAADRRPAGRTGSAAARSRGRRRRARPLELGRRRATVADGTRSSGRTGGGEAGGAPLQSNCAQATTCPAGGPGGVGRPARRRRSARSRPSPAEASSSARQRERRPAAGRHGRHHQHALLDHPPVELAAEPTNRRCEVSAVW